MQNDGRIHVSRRDDVSQAGSIVGNGVRRSGSAHAGDHGRQRRIPERTIHGAQSMQHPRRDGRRVRNLTRKRDAGLVLIASPGFLLGVRSVRPSPPKEDDLRDSLTDV